MGSSPDEQPTLKYSRAVSLIFTRDCCGVVGCGEGGLVGTGGNSFICPAESLEREEKQAGCEIGI